MRLTSSRKRTRRGAAPIATTPSEYGPRRPQFTMQFNLDIGDEGFFDEFCGGGGASEGYHLATGRHVNIAVNHKWDAVAMHRMNHRHTFHYCQDVWKVDPLEALARLDGRRFGGGWYSCDCRHFSSAKGGSLMDRRIRSLAWVLKKWWGRGGAVRVAPGCKGRIRRRGPACPRVCFLENVREFRTWGPLIAKRDRETGRVVKSDGTVAAKGEVVPLRLQWLVPDKRYLGRYYRKLKREATEVGGVWEDRDIRAKVFGAPTIRNRMYAITRFDSRPTVWPAATHGSAAERDANPKRLAPERDVASCLDFSLPCPSIFLSRAEAKQFRVKRPLARASMARLAGGIDRFVLKDPNPYVLPPGVGCSPSIDTAWSLAHTAHGERDRNGKRRGRGAHSVREASPTVTATRDIAVVAATMVKFRGDPASHAQSQSLREPAHTVSAGGWHLGLAYATLAPKAAGFMAQHNGGENGHQAYGHPMSEPASTISAKGCQQAVVVASLAPAPAGAAATEWGLTPKQLAGARRVAAFLRRHHVRFNGELATVGDWVIIDIGMRMLVARELFRIQGFADSYIIDRGLHEEADGTLREVELSTTAQLRMVGNSVSPLVAAALIGANLPEMVVNRIAA